MHIYPDIYIYYADGISMFRRFDLEHNDLEHIVAEIRIPNRKPFLITCVYIPPREANHVTLTTLSDMLARCLDSKLELILMGDLLTSICFRVRTTACLLSVNLTTWIN